MLQGNLSPCAATIELQATTEPMRPATEAREPWACAPQQEKLSATRSLCVGQLESAFAPLQLENAYHSNEDPAQPNMNKLIKNKRMTEWATSWKATVLEDEYEL